MEIQNKWELLYLNALNQLTFLGAKRIKVLLDYFGSAEKAWNSKIEEIRAIPGMDQYLNRFVNERESVDPETEWKRLSAENINCTCIFSPDYPNLLKQLTYPPPILYYRGSLAGLEKPAVAIVGSRRSTFYGKEVARGLAEELAASGVGVVSGMALGVDTAAHQGALAKRGYTVAVLGCGVDHCYPPENKTLMEQIAADGAVISEFSVGTTPLPKHFPQRNRIISGLSLGTVVVEATAKSGSLITANYALEQNREVFAVPGNVGSPYSRGCHRLIKEGACLVETAADILEELSVQEMPDEQLSLELHVGPELTANEQVLLEIIPYQPVHLDNIIRRSGNSASEVITDLLSLELKKLVRQTPGKYFCRI